MVSSAFFVVVIVLSFAISWSAIAYIVYRDGMASTNLVVQNEPPASDEIIVPAVPVPISYNAPVGSYKGHMGDVVIVVEQPDEKILIGKPAL